MTEAAAPDSRGGWEIVAEVGDVYEAELVALRLREAGLEARVVDKSFRQEPLPSVRSFAIVRVYVPAASAEEARGLLAEKREPLGDAGSGEP